MSATLSLQPKSLVRWKGKTFNQIVSSLKKNTNTGDTFFITAQPNKVYRNEIADGTAASSTQRTSVTIDKMNAPGGYITNSTAAASKSAECLDGIQEPIYFNLTENFSERPCHPNSTATTTPPATAADFARNRVRSSGIIKRSTKPGTVNDTYKTSNAEYLESRGLTFKQNQYNFVKEGSKTAIPGDVMSMNNIYIGKDISNYPKLLISSVKGNNMFQYEWIDATTHTITIDDDYYEATTLTDFIHAKMLANGHYYKSSSGGVFYLIEMYYDSYNKNFVIDCKVTSSTLHSTYSVPTGASWSIPTTKTVPCVIIPSGYINIGFKQVVGIATGTYPPIRVENQNGVYSSDQITIGSNPEIRPAFKPIYYKPNNIEFAQQGGVSAGERLARLRYNTITTAAATYRSSYGSQTANAYAYSVADTGVTSSLKWKTGYPMTKVPVINKYATDEAEQCCIEKKAHY